MYSFAGAPLLNEIAHRHMKEFKTWKAILYTDKKKITWLCAESLMVSN